MLRGIPLEEEGASREYSSESWQYLAKAVDVGRVAFTDGSAAKGDGDLLKLAQLIGPMARFRLGDAALAFQIWHDTAARISGAEPKAECEIAAADVAVNDLADVAAAKPLLDAARKHFGAGQPDPLPPNCIASAATMPLPQAMAPPLARNTPPLRIAVGSSKTFIERTAWLGAHARSTEEFLRSGRYVRAVEELRAWQHEFPADKFDGYWSLLFARYWAARAKYAPAIAQAEQLQALNPDSPYIDRLLTSPPAAKSAAAEKTEPWPRSIASQGLPRQPAGATGEEGHRVAGGRKERIAACGFAMFSRRVCAA